MATISQTKTARFDKRHLKQMQPQWTPMAANAHSSNVRQPNHTVEKHVNSGNEKSTCGRTFSGDRWVGELSLWNLMLMNADSKWCQLTFAKCRATFSY